MSKTSKSAMTVDGNSVHMSMPFAKVDKDQRLVSGWATMDNLDTQGDIVLAEASSQAFARARGNIREMHQPLAVGRMVDFREDEYYDKSEKKFYRGIFVTARVSEGAEDTWKKVLDGTLTGFSIGGEINEVSNEFVKEAGKTVRFIKDYDLVELSLVDNPANQLANVLSIQKTATGSVTATGMAVDTKIENVFVCTNHADNEEIVTIKSVETSDCPDCGKVMDNAGWFESGANREEKVDSIVAKFLTPADKEAAAAPSEGGENVNAAINEDPVPEGKEVSSPNPGETHENGDPVDPNAVGNVEDEAEAADVDETEGTDDDGDEPEKSSGEEADAETEIKKALDELHVVVKKSLDESREETLAKVQDLEKKIDDAAESFLSKASELEEKIDGFGEEIKTQKGRLSELWKTLEKYNSADAFKKSGTVTGPVTEQKSSFWDGAFS